MKPKIFVDSIKSLENVFHELIPISQHMGVKVVNYTGSELTLAAPLANNINHQLSAFGGSLFSIAALAGWGMMQLKLCEEHLDANTVVASGDVSFLLPVTGELCCTCSLPDDWPLFLQKIHGKGKGSVNMVSAITTDDEAAMQFNGCYVVSLRNL